MKHFILFILFPLLATCAGAQVPDTVFVEAYTDSTYLIAVGNKNRVNGKMNIRYFDEVFDSAGVVNFFFNQVYENEQRQVAAERERAESAALTILYNDVNSVLQNFTGAGYVNNAFARHAATFTGFYRARNRQQVVLLQLLEDGTAVQVNAQGNPVQGGMQGTWDVITADKFRLKNFFPANVVPAGTAFIRAKAPDNVFFAPGVGVALEKLRR